MFVCNSSFLTSFWHIVIRFDHWITRRLFIEAACTMAQPLYICKHATRVKQDSSTRKKKNSSYLTRCEQRHAHAELNRNHFKRRHVMMTKQIANERRVGLRRLGASAIRNARTIIFFSFFAIGGQKTGKIYFRFRILLRLDDGSFGTKTTWLDQTDNECVDEERSHGTKREQFFFGAKNSRNKIK